jgi:cation diffusion facilitator family transporter
MNGLARDREKRRVAAVSVACAVGLTAIKIVVGISSGSLGILAEAAHSGLDLIAAVMTLLAVRISARPADLDHPYGHGKVENLSALFQTLLLLATCVWIVEGAVGRLISGAFEIEVTIWAFLVMGVSIVVDVWRSRALYAAAHKHHSQALEADALHFHTDIWSSSVVILGLMLVKLSEWFPGADWLIHGDAIAAIMVAFIVVQMSLKLGMRTVYALMDTAPAGMAQKIIAAAESLPGVENCHNVRLRYSGPRLFVDVHVLVDGRQTLQEAHDLTEDVERAIQEVAPEADVTVHPEPAPR